MTFLIFIIW